MRCVACAVSWATWLLFTGVPARCVVLRVRCPGPLGSCSPVCPLGSLLCVCGVLGHLAPVHPCARSVRCVLCAVSSATWLLFTSVPARCVVLCVRCPGPLGSCSPECLLGALCCVCRVLGHLAPVHWCDRSVRCVVCAVSWPTWLLFIDVPARCVCVVCVVSRATWLLFTGAPARSVALLVQCPGPLGSCSPVLARCVVLRVRCPGPLVSCSPVCPLGALCCVCAVLGHLAPVHRCACLVRCVVCCVLGHLAPVHHCARSMRCFAGAVSWATWLLFTGVPARCVALHVRCPGPLGSCSPVYPLGALLGVCGVLATLLLFTGVPARCVVLRVRCPGPLGSCSPMLARCVVLRVRCPGPLGSCSPVCPLGALCCVCAVLGHLAPVHRCACLVRCVVCCVLGHLAPVHHCARSMRCFAGAVSWATWLLFTGVPARCVALHVRCPGPLGSCSPVYPLGALLGVCGVLATLLLFTGVPARCVALRVRCPGPLRSCSPVCPRGLLCCMCGVLGHLAPVHRCACSVRCVACAQSWAAWLVFTVVPARCVASCVRCPGPLGTCSLVCPLGALCCVCSVLGHLAPVHWCARWVHCVACAVTLATWLLFTGVLAPSVAVRVRCPGPLGSCSPVCPRGLLCCLLCPGPLGYCSLVCPLGASCCVCGVLDQLAPVDQCARSVRCCACAVSWATWLLFTGAPAPCVPVLVRSPGPLGFCSLVCPLRALCCVCGVLGYLAPVNWCASSVRCVACAVSWATWLLFTGVPARFVAVRVRCPGPLGSCSPAPARCVVFRVRCPRRLGSCSPGCLLGALCCVCGVLGHLAPVHQRACSVRCVVCAVSWATWLLFTGVTARCAVLCVRCPGPLGSCSSMCPLGAFVLCVWCPGPLGSCSPVRPLGALLCWCGVLGHLAPVHRCLLGALCCVCGVLGHLVPVHRCARSVRCVACALSWATWLLCTGVPA